MEKYIGQCSRKSKSKQSKSQFIHQSSQQIFQLILLRLQNIPLGLSNNRHYILIYSIESVKCKKWHFNFFQTQSNSPNIFLIIPQGRSNSQYIVLSMPWGRSNSQYIVLSMPWGRSNSQHIFLSMPQGRSNSQHYKMKNTVNAFKSKKWHFNFFETQSNSPNIFLNIPWRHLTIP